jgi:hypothetical protein
MEKFAPTFRFAHPLSDPRRVRYYADYSPEMRARHDDQIKSRNEVVTLETILL